MEIDYKKTGKRIREVRKARNITQEQLAELADVSTQHICRIETAKRNPSVEMVYRVAKALGVSPEYLLDGKEDSETLNYEEALDNFFLDCSEFEKAVLGEILVNAKMSLKKNLPLLFAERKIDN